MNKLDIDSLPEILNLKVTPKAKSARIIKTLSANGDLLLKVYVTAVPENGKANQAVIKLLAKELGISKSSLTIIKGQTSSEKRIKISR